MSEKPTYEELAKRVQELEKAESERRQAEEALLDSKVHFREAQRSENGGFFLGCRNRSDHMVRCAV